MQNDNERKWQFWFLVSFSLLLVVTFAFYLPTRFERNFLRDEEHMIDEEMMDMMHEEEHGETVYHEEGEVAEGLVVNMYVSPVPVSAYSLAQFNFFVNERPGSIPVSVGELELEHTKAMHVIGVRSDMNEFFHIHPNPTGERGVFSAPYTFRGVGTYKVWSEVTKDGVTYAFGHPEFQVFGYGSAEQKQVSFGRSVVTEGYQVILNMKEPVAKNREHELVFEVHRGAQDVELENYLGVPMHLAIIKDDLKQFIHTHPEGGGGAHGFFKPQVALANGGGHAEQVAGHGVNFHVTFPEAGLYKVFAQFRPQGVNLPTDESLIASFWIEVQEKTSLTPATQWWLLLVVSLVLIGLLSAAVQKFITVKK